MAAFFFGIKVYVPEADSSHFRGFFCVRVVWSGVPSPPAPEKPPIEENNLPTFNPSISLPSYLFLWPDCQRLPQCKSQYADLLLYLILNPYAASLNSLLKDVLIATQVL